MTTVANEVKTEVQPEPLKRPASMNHPDANILGELTRLYKLTSYNWTSTSVGTTRNFPKDLFTASTYMTNMSTNYKYFRADGVRIIFRMSSTPYHQGALMIGWIPDTTTALAAPSLTQLSACNSVVLSASVQDTATIEIPWLAAVDWCNLITEANPQEIGSVYIQPMTALIYPVGTSDTVEVSIYAQFINPRLSGYVKQSAKSRTNTEAAGKDQKGVDFKSIVSPISKMVRNVPEIGAIWSPIADVINSVAGDLSKPTSNQATTKNIQTSMENLSLSNDEFFGQPLSLYNNAKMEQHKTMYGMDSTHMTMSELAQRPMLHQQAVMTAITPQWGVVVDAITGKPSTVAPDYLAYTAMAHARWRGSIKYLFMFICNAYYTTRVRFYLSYGTRAGIAQSDDLPHQIVEIKGDTKHEITVPYQRQNTWTQTGNNTDAPILYYALEAPIVGASLPATPLIHVLVFRAGGEDIQFSQLQVAHDVTPYALDGTPIVKKQCSIRSEFSKPFAPFIPGCSFSTEANFITPEQTVTISDAIKRFVKPFQAVVNSLNRYTYPAMMITSIGTAYEPYHFFVNLFKYWRGSRRFHSIPPDNARLTIFSNGTTTTDLGGNGLAIRSASYVDTLRVEIPWYSNHPYINTNRISVAWPSYPNDLISSTSMTNDQYLVAAGDDFVGLYLLWPMIFPAPTQQLRNGRTVGGKEPRPPATESQSLHFSDEPAEDS